MHKGSYSFYTGTKQKSKYTIQFFQKGLYVNIHLHICKLPWSYLCIYSGKTLLKDLIPIHKDGKSGFVIKNRVFKSEDQVESAVAALEDITDVCRQYVMGRKEESSYCAEMTQLQTDITQVCG